MKSEPRSLETLIQEFNQATELDTFCKVATGETYWIQVDGIRTRMTDAWLGELSLEERKIFEAHIAQVVDETAKTLGLENVKAQFRDAGQKMFKGMVLGITT